MKISSARMNYLLACIFNFGYTWYILRLHIWEYNTIVQVPGKVKLHVGPLVDVGEDILGILGPDLGTGQSVIHTLKNKI